MEKNKNKKGDKEVADDRRREVAVGKTFLGEARKLEDMSTRQDPWAEAPFYAAGPQKSETITEFPEGNTIWGHFHGLRQSKSGKKSMYMVLTLSDGTNIRLFSPANLTGQFINRKTGEVRIEDGTYVAITYRGLVDPVKEGIEGVEDPFHAFEVLVPKEENRGRSLN